MTERTPKQPKPTGGDRVRYEVYGMPIEDIIANAIVASKTPPTNSPAQDLIQPEPEPAWPSLEELKAEGPIRRGRRGR